jgi:sugar phosphate isomerase/epimerase
MAGHSRLKIGRCNEMFQDWPIEEILDYAAELGCNGVEIAPYSLADTLDALSAERGEAIRRAVERAGIEILGLHWLLVKPEGLSINCPDAAVRARTAEYRQALIRLCADLGGRVLIHNSPGQRTVREGWSVKGSWRRACETFESCLPTIE